MTLIAIAIVLAALIVADGRKAPAVRGGWQPRKGPLGPPPTGGSGVMRP